MNANEYRKNVRVACVHRMKEKAVKNGDDVVESSQMSDSYYDESYYNISRIYYSKVLRSK